MLDFKTEEEYDDFIKVGHNMIVDRLRLGDSLDDQEKFYKQQLAVIGRQISLDENGYLILESGKLMSTSAVWFLSIIALLKMKRIENNNDNGLLKGTSMGGVEKFKSSSSSRY